MNRALRISLFLLTFIPGLLLAQTSNFTVSGYITDANTGETLIGANVYVQGDPAKGTASNVYGFYSLTLQEGQYELVFSYLGFQDQTITVDLSAKQTLDVELSEGVELEEVVVVAKEEDRNVQDTKMGTLEVSVDQIKKLPALLGEVQPRPKIQSKVHKNLFERYLQNYKKIR